MAFPKKTPNGGKGVRIPQNAHLGDATSGHVMSTAKKKAPPAFAKKKGC